MYSDEINFKINLIEEQLKKYSVQKDNFPNVIFDAMNYSLFSGGKRLRPLIMISVWNLFSKDDNLILPYACALEIIHTYSLIHDDLPAMDNDELRRGKPTCHIKYGDAMAILAGDALLNLSYEVLFNTCSDEFSIKAGKEISNCAGVFGMISGQVMDIISENKVISASELDFIHKNKTGKLLKSAFTTPAILNNCNKNIIDLLEKIGYNYGKAFQILDDILDVTSTSDIIGKPCGSDEKNSKVTYVTLHGLIKSKEKYELLKNEVLSDLKLITDEKSFLYTLIFTSFSRIN